MRCPLHSFKNAFSILNFRSSSSSSLTCSALVSTEVLSNGLLCVVLSNLFNVFFRPFLCGLNASEPAVRKRWTQLTIKDGLVMPSCRAKSWYEISLDKYNSTTESFFRKNIYYFFENAVNFHLQKFDNYEPIAQYFF